MGIRMKRTRKNMTSQRSCIENNLGDLFNRIKVFFFLLKALFFFWIPINAFKTFFGKPVIFKVPLRAHNPYII